MSNKKIFKNIDSILQVTKETVNQSDNYYNYIRKQNDSLYIKQLPLLMKNTRISALVLSKTRNDFKHNALYEIKDEKKEKENASKTQINKFISPLSNIRNIQTKSKKLPPLCPLYNEKGELVPSIIKSSKILIRKMINNEDNSNNINYSLGFKRMGSTGNIFGNKKMDIKKYKLKCNKSCDFEIKLDYDERENRQFNEPEYDKLKYNESKIFGQKKLYEDIIKKKIIEFQNVFNKNQTTRKEKIYKYGLEKIKLCLVLDSLKISINEIKNENIENIEKCEKPVFEYILPFALLPLFYFKGVEQFLIILSKLILYNDIEETFEIVKNDDEIISKILKNCADFSIEEDSFNNFDEKETNNNANANTNLNAVNVVAKSKSENNKNNQTRNSNYNINDNKNNSLNNSFINNQNNSSINRNSFNNTFNNTFDNNENNNINTNNNNSNNNNTNNAVNPNNRVGFRESFPFAKKKMKIKTFDIYPVKVSSDDTSTSIYEFFWITSNKSYILTIETPLITVSVPSHRSQTKKYINYELLFYLYCNQFVMWDFYVIKYLSTYKKFRIFLEQIYSLPVKRNIFFYITNPKHKKNLFTYYELTSFLTRPTVRKNSIRDNPFNNNTIRANSPKKKKIENTQRKEINDNNSNENADNSDNDKNIPYQYKDTLSRKNLCFLNFNSLFIQKGLLIVASYINNKKGITNEYTFHFNLDHLRKFQKMEVLVDKLSFFIKFMKINYENETITFDFVSFNDFNEDLWIKDMKKYNFKYLKNYKIIYEERKYEEGPPVDDVSIMKIYQGINKNIQIKIEVKYPLIIMKGLDDNGFKTTEKINVNYKVEKKLSKITINNSLDLTKQIINILKDNNFCRYASQTKRNIRKKTVNKQKKNTFKDNVIFNEKLNNENSSGSLGIVPDLREEE